MLTCCRYIGRLLIAPSLVAASSRERWSGKLYHSSPLLPNLLVQPAPREAEQPLRHKQHHRDKDHADRDQVILGKKSRKSFTQQQEERGADDRSDQGADAADDVVNDGLARDQEEH